MDTIGIISSISIWVGPWHWVIKKEKEVVVVVVGVVVAMQQRESGK